MKQELEKSIQTLRTQITKYDVEYAKNMEVLRAIADNLMNLLRNVSMVLRLFEMHARFECSK